MSLNYKKQHYVPQTYLKAWEDKTGKVYMYDKCSDKLLTHSYTKEIFHCNDLYTKTVDDIPILSDEEKKQIFSCLDDYNIYYNHNGTKERLENFNDYTKYYYDFDNWDIVETTGQFVDKEKLKRDIKKQRITEIEEDWKYIENNWPKLRKEIDYIINKKQDSLNSLYREKLIEFMVVQKYRTLTEFNNIHELIKEIVPFLKDYLGKEYFDEFTKSNSSMYFKKQLQLYQKGEESIISNEIELYKENGYIIFIKAIGKDFISSDNPVFNINDSNFYDGKYNAIYFPITPNLMISLCRGWNDKYSIIKMRYQTVRKFNKKIKDNSFKYYITHYKKY